nr:trna (adenine(58)-n(1))-methyltransferase catalytic subunit trm61 [Quercus suber]
MPRRAQSQTPRWPLTGARRSESQTPSLAFTSCFALVDISRYQVTTCPFVSTQFARCSNQKDVGGFEHLSHDFAVEYGYPVQMSAYIIASFIIDAMLEETPLSSRALAHGFLNAPSAPMPGSLAMLHLQRDSLVPIILGKGEKDSGYAEGAVTNTRFGSFPHSTLAGAAWGSQIRASKVDTGTRGRKAKDKKGIEEHAGSDETLDRVKSKSNKRKSADIEGAEDRAESISSKKVKEALASESNGHTSELKVAVDAGSGFVHILQPTPEAWTSSLDHLFSGRPDAPSSLTNSPLRGRICSYEYHEPRVTTLRAELVEHGLEDTVALTHRDVCNDGFMLADSSFPCADAVFLDLPAPWNVMQHLRRDCPNSPLNPASSVHLCTFSPCIEQVIATVSAMRREGWTDIEMVEVQNRRIDVRREQVGLKNEGLRGVNASAATVEEAIGRLREVESKQHDYHSNQASRPVNRATTNPEADGMQPAPKKRVQTKAERLLLLKKEAEERKLYKEGILAHRVEPEVKTHTSYLVFAILPRQWTESDESACATRWPVKDRDTGDNGQ